MKLVYRDRDCEVKIGDVVVLGEQMTDVKVVGITPPHSPGSTGRVRVEIVSDEYIKEYFPSVFGMEWIEREDQGWVDPVVRTKRVFAIIKKNTGEDVSGYNLDTAIAGIRSILISDDRYTSNELRYIKDWLDTKDLPEMLKKQSGL